MARFCDSQTEGPAQFSSPWVCPPLRLGKPGLCPRGLNRRRRGWRVPWELAAQMPQGAGSAVDPEACLTLTRLSAWVLTTALRTLVSPFILDRKVRLREGSQVPKASQQEGTALPHTELFPRGRAAS